MVTGLGAEALAAGRAFVDLSSWRAVGVAGGDALEWLNDLVSADLAGLEPGRARRSLLLAPTGGIRAAFTVAMLRESLLLIQDPIQPSPIDRLLAPYVLSSDVTVQDRTGQITLVAFPGLSEAPVTGAAESLAPSCLGAGADLMGAAADRGHLLTALSESFQQADDEDLEAWRVAAGLPRFAVDATEQDLPQEAAMTDAVSFGKGCYLGQEAVAKVRNLGHPRRLVLRVEADAAIAPGDTVIANGREAGLVTSVARADGRSVAFVRVRWDGREGPFVTAGGVALRSSVPKR
jgi:folate-binding protein YgfZ